MQTNEVSVKPAVRCPRCERGYQYAPLFCLTCSEAMPQTHRKATCSRCGALLDEYEQRSFMIWCAMCDFTDPGGEGFLVEKPEGGYVRKTRAELQPDDMVVFDGPGAFKSVEYVQPVLDQDFDTRNTHRKPMNDWIHPNTQMPPLETEVLLVVRGKIRKGVRLIDEPTWEETYAPYHYWDDPDNDGQDWGDEDVTGWMHLPGVPE